MRQIKTALIRPNERPDPLTPLEEANVTGIYPALGIAYLASSLLKENLPVKLIDAHAENYSAEDIAKIIAKENIDIAGISTTTLNWLRTLRIAKEIKKASPKTFVIVGGPHLSLYPKEAVSHPQIDAGVIGEGEFILPKIVKMVAEENIIYPIDGVATKVNGKVVVKYPKSAISNLDDIPFPAVELLPLKKYLALTIKRPFFTTITSRGCPYKCQFCSQIYSGGIFRTRSPKNVVDELEKYVKKYKAKEIIFFDETFTINEKRVVAICELILKRGLKFRWNIRARADTLTPIMLRALKKAGCYGVHIGVESGNQNILNKMKKDITIEQVEYAFKIAKEMGFETRGYFMLAYPGENMETIRQTIEFALKLPLDWASFSITVPHPGTPIYEEAIKMGLIQEDYWKLYTLNKINYKIPYFKIEGLSSSDLEKLLKYAYRKFYFRPSWVLNKLTSKRLYGDILSAISTISYILKRKIIAKLESKKI